MSEPDFNSIFQHEPNPLIDPPNPFEAYNKNIDALKNKPEIVSFDRMVFELFEMNELGRKFMEYILFNKMLRPASDVNNPMMQIHAVWSEGYKSFFYDIMNGITAHKQRIQAEANKKPPENKQ